ncbi:hypothetical protein BYT27DRAFT_7261749 [Phlegmacium glaucopus]|nr:hypothetical protein BYT27DRAFT_7261749 [Phlegmacium glaucopus]
MVTSEGTVIEVDDDELFDEKEWIGRGKKPSYLPNLPITDFLSFKLPRLSSEIISSKTSTWFSTDKPTANNSILILRPVPSPEFLNNLEAAYGQAWLDGAKSVIDQRFNDGTDCFPLWTISFWRAVIQCHEVQALWKTSVLWLDREGSKSKGKTPPEPIQQVRQLFGSLAWNSKMSYCNQHTTTLHLSKLLGTAWLSDEHINMMMEELLVELSSNPKPKVQAVDLSFALKISNVQENENESESQKILRRFSNQAQEQLLERLYFPLHVNNNHWIAGMIDFKWRTFSFGRKFQRSVQSLGLIPFSGDSLYAIGKGSGAPGKIISHLQVWLKQAFGKRFKNQGNMLPHAIQEDAYSCPIIAVNTIAHSVFDQPLWTTERAVAERLSWFIHFASAQKAYVNKTSMPLAVGNQSDTSVDAPQRHAHLAISELLNPLPTPQSPNYNSETDSDSSDGVIKDDDASMADGTGSALADSESDYPASSLWEKESDPVFDHEDRNPSLTVDAPFPETTKSPYSFKRPMATEKAGFKHARDNSSDSDSSSSYLSEGDKQPARKYIKASKGTSKSTVASQALRQKIADGTFKIDRAKYQAWKNKILKTDPEAEFKPDSITIARHSICGRPVRVKEPYDFVWWKDHLEGCAEKMATKAGPKLKTPSLFAMGFVKRSEKKIDTGGEIMHQAEYLKCTGALGGGGRSLPVIAKGLFNKLFSKLTMKKNRQKNVADQSAATKRPEPCSKCHTVLQSKPFKNTIRCPIPSDKKIIFVNHHFRNKLLGRIYARTIGVREIIEDEPICARYAQGALSGKYNNEVFNGLLVAMVTKHDKEERSVRMQNFHYAPAWEEVCHITWTHSPRTYNFLREYLPMPTEQNLRKNEACQPRLDFDGPVAPSCDDTKLFATYRLYWDSEQESYFLVGGTDGPLRVAEPDSVKEAIEVAKAEKVTKDDNAAVRLFQQTFSSTPQIITLITLHRSMAHSECIKLALRAHYFLDSWEAFLQSCGYRKDQYFISQEANDILHIIIEGLIALIIIHRDHLSGPVALLPWLHSSEACEHVFGEAHQVVKDFTFLDFIYMIPKLRIKLHQAVLRGKSSNGKARAVGYSHTYFDHEGLDLVALSTYPTDAEINILAERAAQEANSLVALLGVNPDILHRPQNVQPPVWLPGVHSWLDDELDFLELDSEVEDSKDDNLGEARELQKILDDEEGSPISCSHQIDNKCLNLTSAALAITTEEVAIVKRFAEVDEEELEDVVADEFAQVQQLTELYKSLPAPKIHNKQTRPLGHGSIQYDDLDFEMLVSMRQQHQTKQAASGVWTKKSKPAKDTMHGQIIREFHQALKEAQDEKAAGTGKLQDDRWKEGPREPAPGGRGGIIDGVTAPDLAGGNAANAAVAAGTAAKQAATRRKNLFIKSQVPRLPELIEARVTMICPLQVGDFGFVLTASSIMLGHVVAMYSKTGGKNGKHSSITESSSIAAVLYLAVQLFQYCLARQFRSVPDTTAIFQTKQFLLLSSLLFLCLVNTKISPEQLAASFIELSPEDVDHY